MTGIPPNSNTLAQRLHWVAFALLGGMLIVLGFSGHGYVIADIPVQIPGTTIRIPAAVHQWIGPVVLVVLFWLRPRRISLRRDTFLAVSGVVVLVLVWLTTLARHDRSLSLLHGASILWFFYLALDRRKCRLPARLVGIASAAATVALVSYGAIWGETRCSERDPALPGCLVDSGPRIWIPNLLEGIGIPVFAQLRNADLRGLNLSGRDLRYADLRGADLSNAELRAANLRRAKADGIRAPNSSWRDVHMDGASLVGAHLRGADLRGIHAYRVDFRLADMSDTDIRWASLSHAYLDGTSLDRAKLTGTYLRFVEGLTGGQLKEACGNSGTQLPPGFSIAAC